MNKNLLIGILAVVIIIIAAVAYLATQQPPAPTVRTLIQCFYASITLNRTARTYSLLGFSHILHHQNKI